ncbi:MAG: DUF4058 family protein [Actinomycetota bacterium]
MPSPFPGMDPYLEAPDIWPTAHFWLMGGLAEQLKALLPTDVIVSVEERLYLTWPDDLPTVSHSLITPDVTLKGGNGPGATAGTAVLSRPIHVRAPIPDVVRERYLEIRDLRAHDQVLTVLEVLSPANKRTGPGRAAYLEKRLAVLSSDTSLVEIDLLRAGERMPVLDAPQTPGYRVFVSPADTRPDAELYPFTLRDPLPHFGVPVRTSADAVPVDLGAILATAYERGSFAQRLDYSAAPQPALSVEDAAWAVGVLRERQFR